MKSEQTKSEHADAVFKQGLQRRLRRPAAADARGERRLRPQIRLTSSTMRRGIAAPFPMTTTTPG
jgi:hypothetical protein